MKASENKKAFPVVEAGGIRWHVAPESAERFAEWIEKNWPKAMTSPEHWLKRDRRCLTGATDGLVLKTYLFPENLSRHIHRFKFPKARKSFHVAFRLREHGVKLPTPIAWSDDRRLGKTIHAALIMEQVEQGRPLSSSLVGSSPPPFKLFERLGALLGTFHASNYSNRDFKDTNILLIGTDQDPHPLSIDLDGTRRMFPIPAGLKRNRMLRDFMPLLHSLAVHGWDRPEIRRHIASGWSSISGIPLDPRHLPRITSQARAPFEGWSSIRVRLNRSAFSRQVITIHAPTPHAEWLLYAHRFWRDRLDDLDFISASRTGIVFRGTRPGQNGLYYFKRIGMNSVFDPLKHITRPLPALRACRAAHWLSAAGLESPPIMAAIEFRVNGLPMTSGLITEAAPNAEPLDNFLTQNRFNSYPKPIRARIIRMIGSTVGCLHEAGLVHGDMRLNNLLCRMDSGGGDIELVFIDNERTRPCGRLHERARNLVQLNMVPPDVLSVKDRIRCWRAYRQARDLSPREAKRLLRHIISWSDKRWQRRGWNT